MPVNSSTVASLSMTVRRKCATDLSSLSAYGRGGPGLQIDVRNSRSEPYPDDFRQQVRITGTRGRSYLHDIRIMGSQYV